MYSFTCNSNRKLNGRARNRLKSCISKYKLNYKINKAKQQPCFDSEYDIVYRDANYLKAILKKKKLPTQNGYRFIDLQQMQSFISQITIHSISCERAVEIASKGISPYTDLTEIKSYGIACILGIKCKGCNYIHTMNTSSRLQTSKDKINRFDVNVRAVWGSMVTGNGASHLNELLGTMNSPGLRQATFGSIEEEIGQMWHTVLEEEMLAAGAEERRIAIENNNYNEGVPSITVIADGGWSKRSHKHTYNASGGVAIIVGKQTGKILYIGVRNKYCNSYICSRALHTQTKPPEHVCFKNWSASSQAMESDILVEGFKQAEKVHGLRYMQLIADGDSSVYAKIQEEVPVWGKFVTKIECSNHACKCLRSNLEKLVNDNPNYKGQNKLTKTTRVNIVSAVRCAIRMRSKESNRSAAIKLLAHDIRNSVHHIFGNHKNCSNFCKANEKRNETSIASSDNLSTNDIPDIFESQSLLWSEVLLNRLATKSERLEGNDTTNIAESWMHVRSKFDGGFKGNAYTVKGLQEERNSIHEYILKKAESGVNVNVESSGLIIDKNHTFLACNPDGLVNENGEMGLIEIKNILQKKNMSFIQATKKVSNFCLQYTDEKVQLKKKHNYYFQCQGLLNISGLPWPDFIARPTSPYQIHIERIYRDEVLWNDTMLPKLETFYFLALLPELAAPRYNKSPGIREPGDWVRHILLIHAICTNWN
ncbi:Hypothetical predicted protein [Mytilus galloprovincialis]|uniref:YqaJ viral recombinase domain-containing protein n=1 Tax=Mytilus galloprovincialis TaxID=29158 RepID=A0A8B6G0Y7_MYTGA|nr:Hypothetical predicted protein [Mytilus galloprovincialis]